MPSPSDPPVDPYRRQCRACGHDRASHFSSRERVIHELPDGTSEATYETVWSTCLHWNCGDDKTGCKKYEGP